MKLFTTKKAIKECYKDIIAISYCDAQHLLRYQIPFAYNSGVYGWNCDYYDINGIIICTGYRPQGKKCDFTLIREFDKKAENIINTVNDRNDKKDIVNGYLHEFIKKALEV